MKKYIIPILLILALIASLFSYRKGYNNGKTWYASQIDTTTTTQIDTNATEKPVADTEYVDRPVPYPVYIKGDTEYITEYKDSIVYVMLPRTVKEYRKENYYAKVSGVDPSLDYIETYNETITNTVYVPQKIEPKKNFFEVDARLLWDTQPYAPVAANFGRVFGPLEVYAGGGWDFAQHSPMGLVGMRLKFEF